eukprot:gene14343-30526_t
MLKRNKARFYDELTIDIGDKSLFETLMTKSKYTKIISAIMMSINVSTTAFSVHSITWDSVYEIGTRILPPLTRELYKGQMGKVGVLGGSRDYTGAPYYAATAALKFGSDLAYIFCAKEAAIPIKSYSPELMVTPFYCAETIRRDSVMGMVNEVSNVFPRMHTLVIGPGLGRDDYLFRIVQLIIRKAMDEKLSLVIDADGLYFLSLDIGLIQGYT